MTNIPEDRWIECPPDGLREPLARRHRQVTRRRWLQQGLVASVLVVGSAGVATFALRRPQQDRPGFYAGIACRDVVRLHDAFVAGTLDAELKTKVDEHLLACSACRRHFGAASPEQPKTS